MKYNILGCQIVIGKQKIKVFNIHLSDVPNTFYSLYKIPYYDTPKRVSYKRAVDLSYESKQDDIKQILKNSNEKDKVIIVGDFNEPSHLDYEVGWKVSKTLYKHNFIDIVRYYYADASKYPLYSCDIERVENKVNIPVRVDMIYIYNVKPKDVKYIYKSYLSDHIPILATVVI